MTFLSGWVPIAIAAGLTIPPLVALYFLKLRRASLPVSSTLLWKRAVEDLQVNAPFQRIRNNLLLWLQLLVLVLAAFALGKPMIEAVRSAEDTLVVLIDHSASMGVIEADSKTRLDIAKRQAQTVIDNMPDGSRAMVIAFSDRATIVSSFETDKEELKRRIDALQPQITANQQAGCRHQHERQGNLCDHKCVAESCSTMAGAPSPSDLERLREGELCAPKSRYDAEHQACRQ